MTLHNPTPPAKWACAKCGFQSPWWCGAAKFPLCTKCQRIQDRLDAERRREESKAAALVAKLERMEEEMRDA